jgi:hypothetical protein
MVLIDVTLGDALDRLSILDIKLSKIKDPVKLSTIQVSYDTLKDCLNGSYTEYDYKILKYVNTLLFDAEDVAHSPHSCLRDHLNIKKLNTMRVNIKRYIDINNGFKSSIEQKSYNKTKGVFIGHHGYGDMILLNGAIRYASFMVDELYIFCKIEYLDNLSKMFGDCKNLFFIPCEDSMRLVVPDYLARTVTHEFISGVYLQNPLPEDYNITKHFYNDLNIPLEVMNTFFHIPYTQLESPQEPYVFVQTKCRTKDTPLDIITWDIHQKLTIDPNINQYEPGHMYHQIAEMYINKPIASYVNLMNNAEKLHLVDSCFACMAWVTRLNNVIYYDRDTGDSSKIFI